MFSNFALLPMVPFLATVQHPISSFSSAWFGPQTPIIPDHRSSNITALFEPYLSPAAQIFLPSDGNFTEELILRWSSWEVPSYIGAIKPATEADVQTIVKIASANRIPFLAVSTGHGVSSTLGTTKNGIEIDLSGFATLDLDAENNLVTVGGGVRLGQFFDPLYAAGKEITTGSTLCTGALGLALGAGVGPLQGHRGLLTDALKSVRLVTSRGDLITVSPTENADLFWGIRGAGFNFGIITSAIFEVSEATNGGQTMNADFRFPASANQSIFETFASYDETLPSKLSLIAAFFFDRTTDQIGIHVNLIYFGPREEVEPHLATFFALGPTVSNVTWVPWNKLYGEAFAFGGGARACMGGRLHNTYSIGLNRTDVPTYESFLDDFVAFYHKHPDYQGNFVLSRFGTQAPLSIPDSETAYPYRAIRTLTRFDNIYTNTALDNDVNSWMRSVRANFQKTSGFDDVNVYVNFANGDEGPEIWYSARKLERLTRLKREWDPDQLFSYNNPVPLHWP